jgi:prepilin-type processing-associated H-X9-DG protein
VSTTFTGPKQTKWRDGPSVGVTPGAAYYLLDSTSQFAALQTDWQTCNTLFATTTNYGMRGYRWGAGGTGESLFQTLIPPNSNDYPWNSCRLDCGGGCGSLQSGYFSANSNHPGGVNAAMADGSVKFLKSTINMKTYWSLGTKAGGEVLSSDAY